MRVIPCLLTLATLCACALQSTKIARSPEQHAANVTAAGQAGYKVLDKGDHFLFCPIAPPTGSHMGPACLTEGEFESRLGLRGSASSAARISHQSPGPGAGH